MSEFKSAELPLFCYRDPAIAYERIEAQTCQGCKHVETTRIAGIKVETCKKGKRHGTRCKLYVDKSNGH